MSSQNETLPPLDISSPSLLLWPLSTTILMSPSMNTKGNILSWYEGFLCNNSWSYTLNDMSTFPYFHCASIEKIKTTEIALDQASETWVTRFKFATECILGKFLNLYYFSNVLIILFHATHGKGGGKWFKQWWWTYHRGTAMEKNWDFPNSYCARKVLLEHTSLSISSHHWRRYGVKGGCYQGRHELLWRI